MCAQRGARIPGGTPPGAARYTAILRALVEWAVADTMNEAKPTVETESPVSKLADKTIRCMHRAPVSHQITGCIT